MIYRLAYITDCYADDKYSYGDMNYVFEADSVAEAQELAWLEKEANKENHVTNVYVSSIDLPKAKDKITELKKELGL